MRIVPVVIAVAGALLVAGCGSRDAPKPAGSPRAAVQRFVDDLQAGRYPQACAVLGPGEAKLIRANAIGEFHVPAGTHAERLRFINRTLAASKRCPVALRMFSARYHGTFPALRRAAATGALSHPPGAGDSVWQVADQAWIVEAHGGRWILTGTDALAVAAERQD